MLLGADLASYLGAIAGDKIMVITPESSVTPMGFVPRIKRFTVTGIFRFVCSSLIAIWPLCMRQTVRGF